MASEKHGDKPDHSFLTRAAKFLLPPIHSPRLKPTHDAQDLKNIPENEKLDFSNNSTTTANLDPAAESAAALQEDINRRRHARTLPPWIHSLHAGDINANTRLLSQIPPDVVPSRHNHTPAPRLHANRGRQFDHERSSEAVTIPRLGHQHVSRWLDFAQASTYGHPPGERSEIVDDHWMAANLPDLTQPFHRAHLGDDNSEKMKGFWLFNPHKRYATVTHLRLTMMRNPFVPLLIRTTVLAFVLAALAIGVTIYRISNNLNTNPGARTGTTANPESTGDYICKQQTSTYMAFIVDACAVVYLFYITVDEYISKPLGLRRSRDKMRLLFLDLLFIVFSSANLSLAFQTLTDRQWSCYAGSPDMSNNSNQQAARSTCVKNNDLCRRQSALCGVLTIALVAWLMTFAISTLRIVEKISG